MLSLGNKLTLNSGKPIYHFVNKYSIDFDGSDQRIVTDGADTVLQPTTYSFWCKSSEAGQNKGVFGHGGFSIGAFHFNEDASRPFLYLGAAYVYWVANDAQNDGEWHHWVVYLDPNNINNCKLYVDGVLQATSSVNTGSINAYTESLTIGSERQVGGNSFEGKIDEFAVYDRELTQDEITRMYNTYYSPNRVANGNFSQIGNEEVTNGDFSQEGSEVVSCGNFDCAAPDDVWYTGSNTTISGGKLNSNSAGDYVIARQVPTPVILPSKLYKYTVEYTITSGSVRLGDSNQVWAGSTQSTSGTYTNIVTSSSVANGQIYFTSPSSDFVGSIDNVSVKEVGQDWSFGSTWSMGDNVANFEGSGSTTSALIQTQNINLPSGKSYNIKFDISNATGNASIWIGNGVGSVNYFGTSYTNFSNGNYDLYFTMPSTQTSLSFYANQSGSNFTIDNISVKEVGQHWTFGTGWSTDGTKAIFSGTDFATLTTTYSPMIIGRDYKLTLKAEVTNGSFKFQTSGVDLITSSTTGDYSATWTATTSVFTISRAGVGIQNDFTIDNVVIQELKHDATNLMLNAGAYQSANPLITSTKSMEFDGVDNYLIVNEGYDYNNRTFATWFNSADNTKTGTYPNTILSQTDSSGGNRWHFRIDDTDNQVKIYDGATIILSGNINTTTIEENRWYNVVMTEDGTTLKFYINGIIQGSGSVTLLSASDDVLTFGQEFDSTTPSDFFKGEITEAGVWDRVLTDLEVASLYNQGMPTNLLVNRNNYQSGNPTVFNTKQVDFDGTDDYLEIGSALDFNAKDFSVSAWVKTTDTEFRVIQTRNTGGLGTKAGWQISVASSGKWNIYIEDTNGNSVGLDTSSGVSNFIDGNWHNIIITWNNSIGKMILYVDGVYVWEDTDANMINGNINSTNSLIVGGANSGSQMLNGEISQSGIWHSVLTADEVSSLYNHGLPIDLTTDQAAYESSSNLVGYWRMGSGTLDTYPLIADQTNATLGSELVTNGDFALNSSWLNFGTPTTSEQSTEQSHTGTYSWKIIADATQEGIFSPNNFNLTSGLTYSVSLWIYSVSGNSIKSGLTNTNQNVFTERTVTVGKWTNITYIATASSTGAAYVSILSQNSLNFFVDNVSIKQVNGNPAIMTNQTSSDIENGSPYANVILNTDFINGDNWSVTRGNWAISGGTLNTTSESDYCNTTIGDYSSKTMRVKFDIVSYTQGSVAFRIFGSSYQVETSRSGIGTYTEDIVFQSGHNGAVGFMGNNFTGAIDNVTVAEVNTGLQGYWKMGDGTNDEYPVIYDQVDPTLSAELVTNGDFSSGTTGFDAYQGSLSVSDGNLVVTATANNDTRLRTTVSISTVVGRTYLATAELKTMSGTKVGIAYNDGTSFTYTGSTQELTSTGSFKNTFTAANTTTGIVFKMFDANTGQSFSIDNVSLKEIQGNPATMTNMVEGNITNQYPLTKIRNYYRMGDGILDGYPIIQDQTSPNLAHIPTTNLVINNDVLNINTGVTQSTVSPPSGYTGNAYRITEDTTSGQHFASQVIASVTSGTTYTMSMFVKSTYSSIIIYTNTSQISSNVTVDTINGTISGTTPNKISDAGDGWWHIQWTKAAQSTAATLIYLVVKDLNSYTGSTSNFTEYFGVQLEAQSQATPFLKSSGVNAVRKSSTTNLVPYSEDFSNADWNKSNVSVTSNSTTSPQGTINASLIIENSANALHYISDTISVTNGNSYSISIFAKKKERDVLQISLSTNFLASSYANYDLTTGVVSATGGLVNAEIQTLSNDWYRCKITFTATNTASGSPLFVLQNSTTALRNASYQGDGTSGLYLWGAQAEEQTQAETYAKTTGLPVTIDLFTENNYGTMTNMSASDIVEDTPNN